MAVVVPAHNEERHVGAVIEGMPPFVDLVVVVDDGSHDATPDIVARSDRAGLVLVRHAENRGVGAAIVSGYRLALERGADVVVVMGADDQMDPAHLAPLIDPVVEKRCLFAKGNRFFSWGSWSGMPRHRLFGNIVLSLLTKMASGYWHVFDAQNGFTAISAKALRRLPLERLEVGYEFENRLLIELNISGASVTDVPFPARYGQEVSGMRIWRVGPAILWTLFTGFWRRVRRKYLAGRLTVPAGVLLGGGLVAGAGLLAAVWTWLGNEPAWVGRGAVFGIGLGTLLLGLFFVLDGIESARLRPRVAREPHTTKLAARG